RHDVVRREVAFGVDAEASPLLLANLVRDLVSRLRQIADVAVAGPHFVAVLQDALDRPRLGWRLDDHQCLRHSHVTLTRFVNADEAAAADARDRTLEFELEQPR